MSSRGRRFASSRLSPSLEKGSGCEKSSTGRVFKRNYTLKIMHLFYYAIGGIYSAPNVRKRIKMIWFWWCFTVMWFGIIFHGLGFLFTAEKLTVDDIFGVCWIEIGVLMFLVVQPMITYRYHHELDAVLDYIEQKNQPPEPSTGNYTNMTATFLRAANDDEGSAFEICFIEKINSSKLALFTYVFVSIITAPFALIGLIDFTLICDDENSFRDYQHHIAGFPYMHRIPSIKEAVLLYALELCILLFFFTLHISQINLTLMITLELNNIVFDLCHRMQNLATYINSEFSGNVKGDRNEALPVLVFEQNLIAFVREHRTFVQIMKRINPYIEIFFTFTSMSAFVGFLCSMYVILLTNTEMTLKIKHMSMIGTWCVYFYVQCELGHKLNVMKEALVQQVYDLPWYWLPPSQRKLVYIFLCQVQRPIQFKILKLYPLNRTTFPLVWKAAYSSVNIFHYLIQRGHYFGADT